MNEVVTLKQEVPFPALKFRGLESRKINHLPTTTNRTLWYSSLVNQESHKKEAMKLRTIFKINPKGQQQANSSLENSPLILSGQKKKKHPTLFVILMHIFRNAA